MMFRRLLFYHCISLISAVLNSNKGNCPKICKCGLSKQTTQHNFISTCNGKLHTTKMNFIPKFPPKTVEVIFIYNHLPNVSRNTFSNITHLRLKNLDLQGNSISAIQNDSFTSFIYLLKLDLSRNNITEKDAMNCFKNLPKGIHGIQRLRLNHLLWHPVEGLFDGLNNSNVTRIELSHSYLTPFEGRWFSGLRQLKSLDISWNSIKDSDFNLTGLPNIQDINLAGNWFNIIPDFCQFGLNNIANLHMSDTKLYTINHLRNYSSCLQNLKNLYLSGLSIRIIPTNIFSNLKSLKELTMKQMSTQFKKIHKYAFNSSSLNILTFWRADGFLFTSKSAQQGMFDPDSLFDYSKNLKELDLSNNKIDLISNKIRLMFKPLKKLKKLWMESISLSYMPKYFLPLFPSLTFISFENNKIPPWNYGHSVFNGVRNLRIVNLKNNKISMIYDTSFPLALLNNLTSLKLMFNRFSCTCDLQWFRNWMKHTRVNITGNNTYRCETSKTKVVDYNPGFIECHILSISLSIGFGVTFVLIVTITGYICRWRFRFQLYKLRSLRKQYNELVNKDDFVYSAYVVYCYEDFTWVKRSLIHEIEEKQGYKLCIPHRDFELGKVFADNIVEHMHLSETVILVLSNNFAKNEWCLFQLAVAKNKLTKLGKLSIFPLLLEEIEFKNMNSALYHLLKMSSYAAWDNDDNAQKLFWDQIRDRLS
ncbi:toll-like receptor 13 [Mytilus trossulus]|uniref:toll-like receptor 13 n=1 Tax=Mytilus trossulus TaxID=6551 RepID=UPI0030062782